MRSKLKSVLETSVESLLAGKNYILKYEKVELANISYYMGQYAMRGLTSMDWQFASFYESYFTEHIIEKLKESGYTIDWHAVGIITISWEV